MKTFTELLKSHPLFEDFPNNYLDDLSECAREAHFSEGSYIILNGKQADSFFIIRKGFVSIQVQSPYQSAITIQTLGAGDLLGWSWIFPPYQWHFDAEAVEATEVFVLDALCVRGKCENNKLLGYELMQRLAQLMMERLVATRLQLLDLYGKNNKQVVQ